jgi:hypothetical protein
MYLGTAKKRGNPRPEVDRKKGVSLGTEFEFRDIPARRKAYPQVAC